jgi:hypothetical protein
VEELNNVTETNENDSNDLRSQLVAAMRDAENESTSTALEVENDAPSRTRDEQGRFSKDEQGEQAVVAAETPVQSPAPTTDEPAGQETTEAPVQPQAVRPPPGWSPASKAAFDALPEAVKADVAKREEEVNKGFAKLGDYKGLEPTPRKRSGTARRLRRSTPATVRPSTSSRRTSSKASWSFARTFRCTRRRSPKA